jgi:hypothetical protein
LKKVLIISPHFPPSNLAAVHRTRLFAKHLPSFGWEPIVLTVHEDYYEEELDPKLMLLVPPQLRIEKVKAFRITKPRIIGDIGLRGFLHLYRRAKRILRSENIDFVYILIPSFYAALLGRMLHRSCKVKYGIDYIDPWVHHTKEGEKLFSRKWLSEKVADMLEPIAVKKASLISGVAEGYYKGVQERNAILLRDCVFCAMPYGGEKDDHTAVHKLNLEPYLFPIKKDKLQFVYAGAMLPKAFAPLEAIFAAIKEQISSFNNIEFHFIGTGKTPNDPHGYNIKPLAEKYGLWNSIVFEYPQRIPYMDVLIHLENASGVFILGSTEPHYTPSKVYQGVLSGKSIFAVLHKDSTAVDVIKKSKAGTLLPFNGEQEIDFISENFTGLFLQYVQSLSGFSESSVDLTVFSQYSAYEVTAKLAAGLDKAVHN